MTPCRATFICSSSKVEQIPSHNLQEFAFIGRSNVGKSSLINMLCSSDVAHTSSSPGKTRLINHFLVNDSWYLVDLPGYGYAKASNKDRQEISHIINDYIRLSSHLHLLFVLLDCRHPLQTIDRDFLLSLGRAGIPFAIILTKADKLSAQALNINKESILKSLSQWWDPLPPCFVSSANSGLGREDILTYVSGVMP